MRLSINEQYCNGFSEKACLIGMNKQLSIQLDIVRGYAAFFVLLAHTNGWFIMPLTGLSSPSHLVMSSIAHFSVLIFFVLSGFVITNSLLGNKQQYTFINPSAYLKARALRVLPPFLFAFLLSLAVGLIIIIFDLHGSKTFRTPHDLYVARESVEFNTADILATAFLSNGIFNTGTISTNGPLWSLSIEVWLYGIALVTAVAIEKRFRSLLLLVLVISILIWQFPRTNSLTIYACYWALGSAVRITMNYPDRMKLFKTVLLLIFSVGIITAAVFPQKVFPFLWVGAAAAPVNLSILILLIFLFSKYRGATPRVFARIGSVLAKCSYTLYLIHFPLLLISFSFFHVIFLDFSTWNKVLFLLILDTAIIAIAYYCASILEDRELWSRLLGNHFE